MVALKINVKMKGKHWQSWMITGISRYPSPIPNLAVCTVLGHLIEIKGGLVISDSNIVLGAIDDEINTPVTIDVFMDSD